MAGTVLHSALETADKQITKCSSKWSSRSSRDAALRLYLRFLIPGILCETKRDERQRKTTFALTKNRSDLPATIKFSKRHAALEYT